MRIVVVDYAIGNVSAIINMLKKIGVDAIYTNDANHIRAADKLILPGVGAFDHGVENIKSSGLLPLLNEIVLEKKKPILGICLGMQLFLEKSEEGKLPGLGWINGKCVRFQFSSHDTLKIPHMGWNVVSPQQEHPLLQSMTEDEIRFYFVHSYHAVCESQYVAGTVRHGYDVPAVIHKQNMMGAQFHPEKSHRFGMQFLKNFIEFDPSCYVPA